MERTRRPFLICMDSDGCAIDSMTVKHEQAFGPAFVRVMGVPAEQKEEVLKEWEALNLYRVSRGINRFKGFVMLLRKYPEFCLLEELDLLEEWTKKTKALSAEALKTAFESSAVELAEKALEWSALVNTLIEALPLAEPFPHVVETVRLIHDEADIAVVSSANRGAIEEEWKQAGLADIPEYFFAQSDGTKSQCIRRLMELGYDPAKIVMMGDSLGDLEAAQENGVWFYPIIAQEEAESWRQFQVEYLPKFMNQELTAEVQDGLIRQMKNSLGA